MHEYWVQEFQGVGKFGYKPIGHRDRKFSNGLEALDYVVKRFGREFVVQHFDELVGGVVHSGIVWYDKNRGVGISLNRDILDD